MNTRSTTHTAGSPGLDGLADQLGELARSLHHREDGEDTLTEIAETALRLIPRASDASISLVKAKRTMESRAATGDLPRLVDAIQSETGQGPCLSAFHERVIRVGDISADERWPEFGPRAWAAGARSMLCFQLFVQGEELGALNLISREVDSFDPESEQVGMLIATHAAIALAEAKVTQGLNEALINRDLIGQAKGILMERYKISSHQAFVLLSTASSQANMKLSEVAEHLAVTGTLTAGRKRPPR